MCVVRTYDRVRKCMYTCTYVGAGVATIMMIHIFTSHHEMICFSALIHNVLPINNSLLTCQQL